MNEDIKHDYETEVLDKDYNHNDDTPNTTTAKAGGGAARSQITPENVKNEESDVETSSELVNNEKLRENRWVLLETTFLNMKNFTERE